MNDESASEQAATEREVAVLCSLLAALYIKRNNFAKLISLGKEPQFTPEEVAVTIRLRGYTHGLSLDAVSYNDTNELVADLRQAAVLDLFTHLDAVRAQIIAVSGMDAELVNALLQSAARESDELRDKVRKLDIEQEEADADDEFNYGVENLDEDGDGINDR